MDSSSARCFCTILVQKHPDLQLFFKNDETKGGCHFYGNFEV